MYIQSLRLTHYKNYKKESFKFNPKYNAVVGNNGMGKTNLLDAIYFSCMTKSNFVHVDKHLINSKEDFLRTEAMVDHSKIVCKFEKGKKKIFEVNGKAYEKLSDHIGRFPVVFIVPNDQNLLLDGSIERRKLMDNTISQMDNLYLENLLTYNSLLRQRNAYLKLGLKSGGLADEMLMTYTEQMDEAANYIYQYRQSFTSEFEEIFMRKYSIISGGQEKGSCTYKSQLAQDSFLDQSKNSLQKDRILGRTTIGIHKDDLNFKMDGKSVKQFASQGQTKSFILAIKLTQFKILATEKGIKPILLLDDLFDKLDHHRVEQLIQLLEAEEVDQVFISDTDSERVTNILKKMNASYLKIVIEQGKQIKNTHDSEEE
ncbi:DNA replication/repair protein RecF [Portibacter marinus]|uniref:DNA replication/repair protein RecF n=1 Tax=Portibacter marinus TaxID=2898660 RepID=UPI001EEB1661|nr:DNA replication and repair protein RecF [Portibacter marinus]